MSSLDREGTDGILDLPRLAGIVSSVSPDLAALQEVDDGGTPVE